MEMQNVVSLSKLIENQKLQETLQQEVTNIKLYEGDYKRFKEYCTNLDQSLSGEMLVYYLHHSLKEEGVKKNTFNRRYYACKKMLALDHIQLTNEEIELVKQLRKQYRSKEHAHAALVQGKSAVHSDELLPVLNDLPDIRAKAIALVQFYTGCRPSEMVPLKCNDFDLSNLNVTVYMQKQRRSMEKRLPLVCVNAVKAYMRKYNLSGDMYFIGKVDKYDNFHNQQISLSGYNKFLNRHIELSAYNLRKSLVSHMHRKGADIPTIQVQTGHSSARTIAEHYLKVDKTKVDQYL